MKNYLRMNRKLLGLAFALGLGWLGLVPAVGQSIPVRGKVTAAKEGIGLPSVNVTLKGTTRGVTADADGNYSIEAPSAQSVLVFSYIGYLNQEIAVGNRSEINVSLEEDTKALDELVVVGYGTVRKSDLTGSVVSLKSKDLTPGVNVNLQQAMQGRAAGVQIYQKSGEPGSAMSVKIRGASSITAGNDPLYIIDGMPVNDAAPITGNGDRFVNNPNPRNPLNSLNPADVESIEILKDASATAIYGSRGANGVVLITTKRGDAGAMRINYNLSYGLQKVANNVKMLTGPQYRDVLNAIIDEGGGNKNERVPDQVENTDWLSLLYQKAPIQSHDLSFSGEIRPRNIIFCWGISTRKACC